MPDDPCLPRALGRVEDLGEARCAAARRAVLLRVDRPVGHWQHLPRPAALDVLAVLGLVNDPRPRVKPARRTKASG